MRVRRFNARSYAMGEDVQKWLRNVILEELGDEEKMKAFWKDLEKTGRFVKELWG